MEVIGRIIQAFPPVEGTSKAGNPWKKREYILETQETYPKKIFFDFFGERADQYPLNVGDQIKLSFDIESREYNGRWFVSIRGWKAEPAGIKLPQARLFLRAADMDMPLQRLMVQLRHRATVLFPFPRRQ